MLRFLCYVIAQMVGAITGSALVYAVGSFLFNITNAASALVSSPSLLHTNAQG